MTYRILFAETFESEVERFNAWLVVENQALLYENKQLSHLLKDYEGTLDSIMARFRGFAVCHPLDNHGITVLMIHR